MKSLVTEVKLMTALNGLPEAAGLGVVPVAAHLPHDDEEGWGQLYKDRSSRKTDSQ